MFCPDHTQSALHWLRPHPTKTLSCPQATPYASHALHSKTTCHPRAPTKATPSKALPHLHLRPQTSDLRRWVLPHLPTLPCWEVLEGGKALHSKALHFIGRGV